MYKSCGYIYTSFIRNNVAVRHFVLTLTRPACGDLLNVWFSIFSLVWFLLMRSTDEGGHSVESEHTLRICWTDDRTYVKVECVMYGAHCTCTSSAVADIYIYIYIERRSWFAIYSLEHFYTCAHNVYVRWRLLDSRREHIQHVCVCVFAWVFWYMSLAKPPKWHNALHKRCLWLDKLRWWCGDRIYSGWFVRKLSVGNVMYVFNIETAAWIVCHKVLYWFV